MSRNQRFLYNLPQYEVIRMDVRMQRTKRIFCVCVDSSPGEYANN